MKTVVRNIFAVLIIFVGIAVFAYPALYQKYVEWKGQQAIAEIKQLRIEETIPPEPPLPAAPSEETVEPTVSEMNLLWQELVAYNERIYEEGQINFRDPFSYESAPIDLTEYGFSENVIGTLWIPRLELELPIYLGASGENLAKGVAVLGETSLPVSGENTNVAVAGHRGWRGAPMFRDIQLIQIGDKITITTPWETLIYRVCELQIITPDETYAVLIQPGRQMLTLMTCHPYTQNYQRYLVKAEFSQEDSQQSREEDLAEAERSFDATARAVTSTDENGNVQEIQVEPVMIQPVADEGTYEESGAAYSNTLILLEEFAPPMAIALLALLAIFKLRGFAKKERSEDK